MDMSDELASAVRKSWSESSQPLQVIQGEDSPISTPRGTPKSSGRESISTSTGSPVDYQLLKHHYAISDDGRRPSLQEGLMDVLQEMDFSNELRQQPLRRGSIEEVSKIRQWLNPRSSFSGASRDEPAVSSLGSSKCWVTAIETEDDYLPILVLRHSLVKCGSHYRLLVLYTEQTSAVASRLAQQGVDILKASEVAPILRSPSHKSVEAAVVSSSKWCKLFPFVSLANTFEMVCYLSPRSLVLTNIDELLDSEAVASEIDNETCVLLSNCMQGSPTILVLRPNQEIEACIREYMTVYQNQENNGKWAKLQDVDGISVLREIFQDSWGLVAAEFCHRGSGHVPPHTKVIECTTTRPWDSTFADEVSLLWRKAYGQLT